MSNLREKADANGPPLTTTRSRSNSPRLPARRASAAVLAAAGLLTCAACSGPSTTAAAQTGTTAVSTASTSHPAMPNAITVTDPVIVEPAAPGDPTSIIFTVVNGTGTSDAITSVTSTISSEIVLNNTLSTGSNTAPITLAAHTTAQLSAYRPHIWVFNPATLHPGTTVPVTVHFQHNAPITIKTAIRTSAQMAQTAAATANAN